jgi:hypothetical protein
MYMEEYYPPEEAVESILKHNLYGLDIDDRAAQLATFAILLKAAEQYPDIWHKNWLPQVYAMPEAKIFSPQEIVEFLGPEGAAYTEELENALKLMQQAKNLGSVMKLELSEEGRAFILKRFLEIENSAFRNLSLEAIYQNLKRYIPVLLILTKKYAAVVANPPYMGQKNMNASLKDYVNEHYPRSKSDLFAVFMESILAMNIKNGLMGMINQHSWMFLSSYEKLRTHLLDNFGIANMLHLGPRTFEELSGEVVQSTAFVLKNGKGVEKGTYYRLVDFKKVKEQEFLKRHHEFANIPQTNFSKIPGSPIAFWVSERFVKVFIKEDAIGNYFKAKQGLATGKNSLYYRIWSEVDYKKLGIGFTEFSTARNKGKTWFPINKGGSYRKWYGNLEYVIVFDQKSRDMLKTLGNHLPSEDRYLSPSISWSDVTSKNNSFRFIPAGCLFDATGHSCFFNNDTERNTLLAYLNNKFVNIVSKILNPTLHFHVGYFNLLPHPQKLLSFDFSRIVNFNIFVSKKDWDSRETSWDFVQLPIRNGSLNLEQAYQTWQAQVTQDFFQLHENEEELNRIFIDIYGLQDELTPEVELKDITILQNELKKSDLEALESEFRTKGKDGIQLPINKSEVISQFISYAIGLFMGRYRMDQPGLNIAHPNPTAVELASYAWKNGEVIIDEDAIVPLMGKNCNFPDEALNQVLNLLDTLWGHETRTENLNFIQECLDKDLEKFLVKDFYKYHCKMYKKKPIYWLFSSPKGAFQVLVYMHRMNAFTVEKIRANYLLEHMKNLRSEEALLAGNESTLSTQEARKLEQIRKDLHECEAYDLELKNVADGQISFDLDDGVTANYQLFASVVAKIK